MAKIYIVIPTYNEKANIESLLGAIFQLPVENLFAVVVDDNSPDGTGQLVDQLCRYHRSLTVIHREKKAGLGPAYVAGFRHALAAGADYIFAIDADWSHDPVYIPQFLAAIENADLVLGSRYVPGGGVTNWNISRRLISRVGNIYARLILGTKIHDLTGGFKCYRRAVLEKINLDSLSSVGYNFQIETSYKALRAGFRVVELPIVFVERAAGQSKFSLKIILESFWQVLRLRFRP